MATGDLTTLAKLRTHLGQPSNSTADEAELTMLVSAASARIAAEVGSPLIATTYAEIRDGTGRAGLVLRRGPVRSVSSIVIDGESLTSGWTLDGDTVQLTDRTFTYGTANIVVTYSAGVCADQDHVPADLDFAAVELAAWIYRQKDRIGLSSRTVGGEVTVFQGTWASEQGRDGLPASVAAVIRTYRRPSV